MTDQRYHSHYKTLIIGLDGATFDLMLPWIEEGRLPHLRKLIREGAYSRLRSTTPPITPCAWSSFMTGKNPGKHGLFDFVEPTADGRDFRFTNASARQGETLWGCLGRHGRRVGVVNVPMTFPPERVNGYLLSGLDTPHEHSNYCFPTTIRDELRRQGIPYRVDLRHLGDMRTDRRRDRRIRDLHEMEAVRTQAVRYLQKTYPTDFTAVVYIATDQVQHHFWHYMDPQHDKFDAAGARKYGNVIRDTYVHLDSLIGQLLEDIDDQTVVIVMSDHGFGPTTCVRVRGNQALAQAGLLRFKQPAGGHRQLRACAALADRVLRSSLPPGWKAWLSGTFPRLRRWFERADEAAIDWDRTRAFFNEAYRASPAVWLNKTTGTDGACADVEHTLTEIKQALERLQNPGTGERLISELVSTRDVYTGPYASRAPDVLLSWWLDGFLLEQSDPVLAAESTVEQSMSPVSGGVEFSGSHRMDGVFIMYGGPTRRNLAFTGAEIVDVAPTVLYLMGLPIPADMDGRPLTEALDPLWAERRPLREDPAADKGFSSSERFSDPKDERRIARRLRALGYIE